MGKIAHDEHGNQIVWRALRDFSGKGGVLKQQGSDEQAHQTVAQNHGEAEDAVEEQGFFQVVLVSSRQFPLNLALVTAVVGNV